MGNGALAIGPKLPRPSSTLPAPASASSYRDYPRHRRARGLWWSILRAICQSLARRFFSRTGAVLMRAYDGGIDHHIFVVAIAASSLKIRSKTPLFAHRPKR